MPLDKVRIPRISLPLTPKEKAEWDRFKQLCDAADTEASGLLRMELERLAGKGHPAAQRVLNNLALEKFRNRKPGDPSRTLPKRLRFGVIKVS